MAGPNMILRLGSHAEKDYVEKLRKFIDGVIVGANLMEATPGATASMAVRLMNRLPHVPVYLDPMTYAFGTYVDAKSGLSRDDLDWIKSDQVVRGDRKGKDRGAVVTERRFKRSYEKLAEAYGGVFATALKESKALTPAVFDEDVIHDTCATVLAYQAERIESELQKDPELRELVTAQVAPPPVVFAPYFYIDPTAVNSWTGLNLRLARQSAKHRGVTQPVHMVLCDTVGTLRNSKRLETLVPEILDSGVKGVWLWFSTFSEEGADRAVLRAYADFVAKLAAKIEVHTMHGGFFSFALGTRGMRGVSHGVGYGEQKDVVPVIGQSTPTVRYYAPPVRKRMGVPNIQRAFPGMGIENPEDFFRLVCDCSICRGLLRAGLDAFCPIWGAAPLHPAIKAVGADAGCGKALPIPLLDCACQGA